MENMKTRKNNNDGTVTIKLNFSLLHDLSVGLRESIETNLRYSREADSDYISSVYVEFAERDTERLDKITELFNWSIDHEANK